MSSVHCSNTGTRVSAIVEQVRAGWREGGRDRGREGVGGKGGEAKGGR